MKQHENYRQQRNDCTFFIELKNAPSYELKKIKNALKWHYFFISVNYKIEKFIK